ESNSPQVTERILMLLLMNDGKTYQEISDFIGCSYRSVAYWCVNGDADDLETLKDGRKKGNYRKATGQRSHGRVNVMGGVRYHDQKRKCYFIERGNSESFYEQLEQLNKFVKEEWVEQGNEAEEFEKKGPKILMILDNASYHKKKTTLEKIEKNFPNIQLYFLPAYSPDLNLVELVWHSTKEYIAHRLLKSVEDLRELLDKLLNQGELIIQWRRKVKNKGNAVIAN
ncbi:MAG TPA: IS630 family transposase, partial [Stenomitos sp.]